MVRRLLYSQERVSNRVAILVNYYYSSGGNGRKLPFGNPLANALVVLVGTLAVVASIVLGFIAFVVIGGLVLIMAAVIGVRVWWFKRQLARSGAQPGSASSSTDSSDVIEGEFREISDSQDRD